jgi:hypothetical protein
LRWWEITPDGSRVYDPQQGPSGKAVLESALSGNLLCALLRVIDPRSTRNENVLANFSVSP